MFSLSLMIGCLSFLLQLSRAQDSWFTNNSAGSAYNRETEFCCYGVTSSFASISSPQCCGPAAYDSSRQICCENKVFPLEEGEICCGDRAIDTSSEICCDGVSHPRSSNSITCCQNLTYDSSTEICCQYEVPIILSIDGDPSRTTCCGDKMSYNPTADICCVSVTVDSERHFVPHFNLTKKMEPTDDGCCGSVSFNSNDNVCCDDKLYDLSHSCCRTKELFSPTTQVCCSDNWSLDYEVADKSFMCCGSKAYDPDKEGCCDLKVSNNANGTKQSCCMDELYDPDTEVCCYNYNAVPYSSDPSVTRPDIKSQPVRKFSNDDNDCCGKLPYNQKDQMCCSDYITGEDYLAKKLSFFALQCCGDVAYGFTDGLCCGAVTDNGTIQPHFHKFNHLFTDKLQCCGDQIYNAASFTCCGGVLLNSSDSKKACCDGDKEYNPDTQQCCKDAVNYPFPSKVNDKKLGSSNYCCGMDLYDSKTDMCCWDNVYKIKDGLSCCGNKTYDSTRELCCNDGIVTKNNENQNTCCYYYLNSLNPGF